MRSWKMGDGGWKMAFVLLCLGLACVAGAAEPRAMQVLIIQGAEGTPEYGAKFAAQEKVWTEACAKAQVGCEVLTTLDAVKARLVKEAAVKDGALWIVLIGHGTFDGREAKFNLNGPDFSAEEFGAWVKPIPREVVIIDTASASGAFVKPLTGPKRVIVSATKSADEVFYTRFGEHFAKAIAGSAEADMDQDKEVSVLEAFLFAAKQVAAFYEANDRIATEHAIIEDNGDGVGTRSERFEGTVAKDAKADGARAQQLHLVLSEEEAKLPEAVRTQRDTLEAKVREVVAKKAAMKEDEYYRELEKLFVEIAKLNASK